MRLYTLLDDTGAVLYGVANMPEKHPSLMRLAPQVPLSKLDVGQVTLAWERRNVQVRREPDGDMPNCEFDLDVARVLVSSCVHNPTPEHYKQALEAILDVVKIPSAWEHLRAIGFLLVQLMKLDRSMTSRPGSGTAEIMLEINQRVTEMTGGWR